MSKEANAKATEDIYAAPVPNMLKLTTGINRISANDPNVNGFTLRNQIIHKRKQAQICEKNDQVMPPSALARQAEGQRFIAATLAAKQAKAAALKQAAQAQRNAAIPVKPRGKNL